MTNVEWNVNSINLSKIIFVTMHTFRLLIDFPHVYGVTNLFAALYRICAHCTSPDSFLVHVY